MEKSTPQNLYFIKLKSGEEIVASVMMVLAHSIVITGAVQIQFDTENMRGYRKDWLFFMERPVADIPMSEIMFFGKANELAIKHFDQYWADFKRITASENKTVDEDFGIVEEDFSGDGDDTEDDYAPKATSRLN